MREPIRQRRIGVIIEDANRHLAAKDYQQATDAVKRELATYPNEKILLDKLADIEKQYKEARIEELQHEAILLIQTGSQEEAQKRLREILRLDPKRTDLLDSLS